MNYLLQRSVKGYKFIDGIFGSRKSAERMRDSAKKYYRQKGVRYHILKRAKVECPTCKEMVKGLTSHGCCGTCQAKHCYMGTV